MINELSGLILSFFVFLSLVIVVVADDVVGAIFSRCIEILPWNLLHLEQIVYAADATDTVDSFRRRKGGTVVVVSGVAVATLLIFCFCSGGFIEVAYSKVPLRA